MGKVPPPHILSHCPSPPPPEILGSALSTAPEIKSPPAAIGPQGALRVGVIGYGYWGPNLVRNFNEAPGSYVNVVADRNQQRRDAVQRRYPWITAIDDASDLIADRGIDAVVIATPVATHFYLALEALRAGKHVLVEK